MYIRSKIDPEDEEYNVIMKTLWEMKTTINKITLICFIILLCFMVSANVMAKEDQSNPVCVIKTSMGDIYLELFAEEAPRV